LVCVVLAVVLTQSVLGRGAAGSPLLSVILLGIVAFAVVVFVSYVSLVDGLREEVDRLLVSHSLE
jgi:hypothetical protein